MKGTMAFLVAVAALVLALYLLGQRSAEHPAPPAAATAAAPTPAPPRPSPPPVTGPAPLQSLAEDQSVLSAAAKAGVRVVRFDRDGGRGEIEVEWSSDVMTQGMDFVEALLSRRTIRDFDMNSVKRTEGTTPDGRRLVRMGATVMF